MKDTKSDFQKHVLPNGLTVLLYQMDSVKSVYLELLVRVGGVYESDEEQGISHFVEHASLLGTKKYKTKLDIARHAERIGASFNGSTNRFSTIYWVKLPYNNVLEGLDLLHQFVFDPVLDRSEILRDKKIVLTEFNDYWGNPEKRFWREVWTNRFVKKDHPYSREVLGNPNSIEDFNEVKVKSWRDKHYHPNNMILTLAGNFSTGEITENINELFGAKKRGLSSVRPVFSEEDYSDFKIYGQDDSRSQMPLNISFPAFGSKGTTRKERMTLGIINYVLTSGTGARLFQRLRYKEGLVYSVNGRITIFDWLGAYEVESSASLENIMSVFKILKEELDKLIDGGITDEELDLARGFMNYSSLLNFDNPVDIAHYVIGQEFNYDEIWFPEKYIEESKKITKKDVSLMIKEIFDYSKINISLLGNIPANTIKYIENIFKEN